MRRSVLAVLLIATASTSAATPTPANATELELTRKDASDAVRRWARRCVEREAMSGFKLIGAKRNGDNKVLIRFRDWVDAPEGRLRSHYWVEARRVNGAIRVYPFPAESVELPIEASG